MALGPAPESPGAQALRIDDETYNETLGLRSQANLRPHKTRRAVMQAMAVDTVEVRAPHMLRRTTILGVRGWAAHAAAAPG